MFFFIKYYYEIIFFKFYFVDFINNNIENLLKVLIFNMKKEFLLNFK